MNRTEGRPGNYVSPDLGHWPSGSGYGTRFPGIAFALILSYSWAEKLRCHEQLIYVQKLRSLFNRGFGGLFLLSLLQ